MIYVMSDGAGNFKIGFTATAASLGERKRTLETGRADALAILFIVQGSISDERAIHRLLARHRVRGEWFKRSNAVSSALFILRHYGPGFLLAQTFEQLETYWPFGDKMMPGWSAFQYKVHFGSGAKLPWWATA